MVVVRVQSLLFNLVPTVSVCPLGVSTLLLADKMPEISNIFAIDFRSCQTLNLGPSMGKRSCRLINRSVYR